MVFVKGDKVIVCFVFLGLGKSILVVYLFRNGWCLLLDEMVLILFNFLIVIFFVWFICLKNYSIDLVKCWFLDVFFFKVVVNIYKGDVIYLCLDLYLIEYLIIFV